MESDEIQRSLGEIKGIVTANHEANQKRFDTLEEKVGALHDLHQRLKGAMALISLFVVAAFHAIVEGVKSKLR